MPSRLRTLTERIAAFKAATGAGASLKAFFWEPTSTTHVETSRVPAEHTRARPIPPHGQGATTYFAGLLADRGEVAAAVAEHEKPIRARLNVLVALDKVLTGTDLQALKKLEAAEKGVLSNAAGRLGIATVDKPALERIRSEIRIALEDKVARVNDYLETAQQAGNYHEVETAIHYLALRFSGHLDLFGGELKLASMAAEGYMQRAEKELGRLVTVELDKRPPMAQNTVKQALTAGILLLQAIRTTAERKEKNDNYETTSKQLDRVLALLRDPNLSIRLGVVISNRKLDALDAAVSAIKSTVTLGINMYTAGQVPDHEFDKLVRAAGVGERIIDAALGISG